jgi:transposase
MLSFTGSLRILIALTPCDMRRSYDGLLGLIAQDLKENARAGALFVFTNKSRTRLKILYWDGSGLWLMAKRLEKGTFSWPQSPDATATKLQLSATAFAMLTDGVELKQGSHRAWYDKT